MLHNKPWHQSKHQSGPSAAGKHYSHKKRDNENTISRNSIFPHNINTTDILLIQREAGSTVTALNLPSIMGGLQNTSSSNQAEGAERANSLCLEQRHPFHISQRVSRLNFIFIFHLTSVSARCAEISISAYLYSYRPLHLNHFAFFKT